jgi:hypothetical protein
MADPGTLILLIQMFTVLNFERETLNISELQTSYMQMLVAVLLPKGLQ